MSQRVPNWEVEDSNDSARLPFHDGSNSHPSHHLLRQAKCGAEYEVTELTWENGHLAMHGLGGKEKPRQGGTLESIVRQATAAKAGEELVPWLAQQGGAVAAMDALVPCSGHQTLSAEDHSTGRVPGSAGPPPVLSSARVGSCSASREDGRGVSRKRSRAVTSIDVESESRPTTVDSTEFSPDSPTNTDDPDTSSYLSRPQRVCGGRDDEKMRKSLGRSCSSIKRSRAAAIHNQSERKRRDRINQRMKTLQKLVPNSSKTDKASMLDEVIEYLKQLQAQVQMMSKISTFPHVMMPMAMQPMAMQQMQQMQMAMMAQMGMGFGMGMGMGVMDMNTLARTTQPAGLPPIIHPSPAASTATFLPMSTPWEGFTDRIGVPGPVASQGSIMTDSLAAFLAGQTQTQAQPMTLDAYSRLAMLYQQLHQQTGPPHPRT